MGRSGNMLGPQFDQSAIQEVFTDHDAEMLIVHPDLEARASGWRRPTPNPVPAATSAAQLDREPAHARTIAGESRLASDIAAAPRVGNAQRGAEAVRVPVYWQVSLPTAKNILFSNYFHTQQAFGRLRVCAATCCFVLCQPSACGCAPVQRRAQSARRPGNISRRYSWRCASKNSLGAGICVAVLCV